MKIGIMGAMDSEIARFLEELTDQQVHQINGFHYYDGSLLLADQTDDSRPVVR